MTSSRVTSSRVTSSRVIAKRKKPEDEQSAMVALEPGQVVIKPVKFLRQTQLRFSKFNGLRRREHKEEEVFQGWLDCEQPGDKQPGDKQPGDKHPGDEQPGDEQPGDEDLGSYNLDEDLASVIDQSGQLFAEVADASDLDWLFVQGGRSALDLLEDAEDTAPDVVISRCR